MLFFKKEHERHFWNKPIPEKEFMEFMDNAKKMLKNNLGVVK